MVAASGAQNGEAPVREHLGADEKGVNDFAIARVGGDEATRGLGIEDEAVRARELTVVIISRKAAPV